MSRQDMRHQHQRTGWIISAITAGVLLAITIIAVILVNMRPGTPNQDNRVAQSSSSVFTSSRQSKATNNQAGESTSTAQSSPDAGTKTVSDPSKYDYLSGTYENGAIPTISLDFGNQTSSGVTASGDVADYSFTKVLRHPDGTLVVNVSGSFKYNVDPNNNSSSEQTAYVQLSFLIAPQGVTVTKNWQTGSSITDNSDTDSTRFAIANSNDGGKTFNMSTAYDNFESNQNLYTLQQY